MQASFPAFRGKLAFDELQRIGFSTFHFLDRAEIESRNQFGCFYIKLGTDMFFSEEYLS